MNSPIDPFAQHFDALLPTPLPGLGAGSLFEPPHEFSALPEAAADGPGFTLLDDAGGRFAIERDTGIISLAHDEILEREHGAVFGARVRVQEPSGETYELNLRLRIDGRVPQIAENDFANLALVPTRTEPVAVEAPRAPPQPWAAFAVAAHGARAPLGMEDEPFGALIPPAPVRVESASFVPFQSAQPATPTLRARWSV